MIREIVFVFSSIFKLKFCGASHPNIRGLLEKYPTFGREKETGLLGALDT